MKLPDTPFNIWLDSLSCEQLNNYLKVYLSENTIGDPEYTSFLRKRYDKIILSEKLNVI